MKCSIVGAPCAEFSDEEVPIEIIEKAIACAGTAPSGANLQPWRFVVIQSAEIKRQIREAAEKEEYESYQRANVGKMAAATRSFGNGRTQNLFWKSHLI